MIAFSTLRACLAYETRFMSRPATSPPTTHAVPALWDCAKAMLATLLAAFGSALRLACRPITSRERRADLLRHLEPVEKLTRCLLVIEAITLLLMTPWGVRLRHTTRPGPVPEAPLKVGARKPLAAPDEAERVRAAMMTIAANRPRIDPRVAEREAREKDERRRAALAEQRRLFEAWDASALDGPFRVLHWVHDPGARIEPSRQPRACVLDDDTLAAVPARASISLDPPEDIEDDGLTGPLVGLARRIAALERVLADPGPAIRRLARRIAAIPRGHFRPPWPRRLRAVRWAQGCREYYNACILAKPAYAALNRSYGLPPHDPG